MQSFSRRIHRLLYCYINSVVLVIRQWIMLAYSCPTLWKWLWTGGSYRWDSQWSPSTPVLEKSLRSTSCWTQILWWTYLQSSSMNLFSCFMSTFFNMFWSCHVKITRSLLSPYLLTCVSGWCGSSYEWFVPITWIKTGAATEQYWLLTKEGTIYCVSGHCSLAKIN